MAVLRRRCDAGEVAPTPGGVTQVSFGRPFRLRGQRSPRTDVLTAPLTWRDLEVSAYDGLLLAGSHAPGMRQHLGHVELQAFIAKFWATGKPLGAICPGVLVLARSKDANDSATQRPRRSTRSRRGL